MASAQRSPCSPLDIYFDDIDTSKILIAKTFKESLPDDAILIPTLEDCCSNSVTATYQHDSVYQLAIILFQYPITDIHECQEQLKKIEPDVFIFAIEPCPKGLVVTNSYLFDSKQLYAYINSRESGIGPEADPEVFDQEGNLLIVEVRNTRKVLHQVFSRTHIISGQSVDFHPYFPGFHDTLSELLDTSDPQNPVTPSRVPDMYPGTPYPDTNSYNWSPWQDSWQRFHFPDVRHQYNNYPSPFNRGRDDYFLPSDNGERDDDRRRSERYDSHDSLEDGRRDDRHYSPSIPTKGLDDVTREWDRSKSKQYPHVTEDDDLSEGKKETIQIQTSSICEDDKEKEMVSVCLESSIGKQFLDQFQKNNGCEIEVKFKKKTVKPIQKMSTSNTTSGGTGRKTSCDVSSKQKSPSFNIIRLVQNTNHGTVELRELFSSPSLSFELGPEDVGTICTDHKTRQSQARPVVRSDTITINGTKLTIKKGDVSLEKAEVLVNVVEENLELQIGLISKAFVKRGGDKLTQAYQTALQTYDGNGAIACDGESYHAIS